MESKKTHLGMELQLYSFQISTLNGDDVEVLGSGRFTLGEKATE
jgi:hypothetical protein